MNIKTEEFYRRFCEKFPEETGKYKPLEDITYLSNHYKFETEYGPCLTTPIELLKGVFPTIKSAVNPTEYFINKSRSVHGDIYDYSKTIAIKGNSDVIITCKKHGDFIQDKSNHMRGSGCIKCFHTKEKYNLEEVLLKSKKIYGDKLIYDKAKLVDRVKISLECKIHGEFTEKVFYLLKGKGCTKCSKEIHSFMYSYYGNRNTDVTCYLYIMNLYNDEENFIKIGISNNIERREKEFSKLYNTQLLYKQEFNLKYCLNVEKFLLNMLHDKSYTPLKDLHGGYTECISGVSFKEIKKLLKFKIKYKC